MSARDCAVDIISLFPPHDLLAKLMTYEDEMWNTRHLDDVELDLRQWETMMEFCIRTVLMDLGFGLLGSGQRWESVRPVSHINK